MSTEIAQREFAPRTSVSYQQSLNVEAEQSLIGACLANNEAMNHVGNDLLPEHFYAEIHQWIFTKLREYRASGQHCSPVTIKHLMDEEAKGMPASYLAKLVGAATSVINVHDFAQVILDCAMRRELQKGAHALLTSDADAPLGDMTTILAEAVTNSSGAQMAGKMHSSGQVTELILRDIDDNVKPRSTGIARLDKAMRGGLYKKKLYALAGRKKHGKTILAGSISYNINEGMTGDGRTVEGGRHLFICGEMGEKEIHQRNLSRTLDMNPDVFLLGEGRPDDFHDRIAREATEGQRNIIFCDAPGITFEQLKQLIASAVARHKIEGFILDYWQLVGGKKAKQNPVEHLDDVAQWLAQACKIYDVWGIVTSQVNKEGSTRGGEGLLNACDQAYAIQRPNLNKGEAWLQMLESRYTRYMDVGTESNPGLMLNGNGPFFASAQEQPTMPAFADPDAYGF